MHTNTHTTTTTTNNNNNNSNTNKETMDQTESPSRSTYYYDWCQQLIMTIIDDYKYYMLRVYMTTLGVTIIVTCVRDYHHYHCLY